MLDVVHVAAMNRGLALIEKIHNAWDVRRRLNEKEVVCVPGVKTGVDYRGVLRGGRALYVECKSCSSSSFPLSNIQKNQVDQLTAAEDLGAACFLVIVWDPDGVAAKASLREMGFPGGPVLVALPWSEARAFIANNARSVPTEKLLEFARTWSFYAGEEVMSHHRAVDEIESVPVSIADWIDPSRPKMSNRPSPGQEATYRECFRLLSRLRELTGSSLEHVERELVKVMIGRGIIARPKPE
jgi:hypothetical protein